MKKVSLFLLDRYRRYFSRWLVGTIYLTDRSCRFSPTCSQYTYQAISRYGIIKGVWRGLTRLLRCHPFAAGGLDPLK